MDNVEMKTGPGGDGAGQQKTGWTDTQEREDYRSFGLKRKHFSTVSCEKTQEGQ